MLSLFVSFIPALLLFRYLRNLRKDDLEYRKNCRRLLRNGVFCSIGVALLALVISILWGLSGLGQRMPLLKAAFQTFILAAFIEESVKYRVAG